MLSGQKRKLVHGTQPYLACPPDRLTQKYTGIYGMCAGIKYAKMVLVEPRSIIKRHIGMHTRRLQGTVMSLERCRQNVMCQFFFLLWFFVPYSSFQGYWRSSTLAHHYHVPAWLLFFCVRGFGHSKMGPKDQVSVKFIEPFCSMQGTPFLRRPTASRDVVNRRGQIRVSGGNGRDVSGHYQGIFNLGLDVECSILCLGKNHSLQYIWCTDTPDQFAKPIYTFDKN